MFCLGDSHWGFLTVKSENCTDGLHIWIQWFTKQCDRLFSAPPPILKIVLSLYFVGIFHTSTICVKFKKPERSRSVFGASIVWGSGNSSGALTGWTGICYIVNFELKTGRYLHRRKRIWRRFTTLTLRISPSDISKTFWAYIALLWAIQSVIKEISI